MARSPRRILTAHRQLEGGGFPVRRPIPGMDADYLDPFLLLDEMGPVDWPPGQAIGAPDHPHRGFETVTYLLEGEMQHADSAGNRGTLRPGDVQWMTAGRGVVHSELPSPQMLDEGGRSHGFQLWVNLPASDKMMAPRYQEIPAAELPCVTGDGFWVRVIAGRAHGQHAVIDTRIPITYLHYRLEPGARVDVELPREQAGFVYVFDGALEVGEAQVHDGQLAHLDASDDALSLHNASDGSSQCLVLGGKPLGEPVARYGPFVMNTREQILQAFEDFRHGRLG